MRCTILMLLLILTLCGFAQNLVRNPGFEESLEDAPAAICYHLKSDQFTAWLATWSTSHTTTPDYIRMDPASLSCHGAQPLRGQAMIGMYTFQPSMDSGWPHDYHEFVQGELRTTLQAGATYRVSLWVQLKDSLGGIFLKEASPYVRNLAPRAANNIGIFFSEYASTPQEDFPQRVRDFKLRPQVNLTEVVDAEGEWVQLTTTFRADAAYRYFTIGNFYSDARTTISPAVARDEIDAHNSKPGPSGKKPRRYAYYLIDEVYVGPDTGEPALAESLEQAGTFTFKEVQFATNEAILQTGSRTELDQLAAYLKMRPGLLIEIGGHTDAIGGTLDKQQLSEARAQAVYDYLVQQGIPEAQLRYRGFGESMPIAPNDTAAGRAKSWRVECTVLERQ